MSVISLPLLIVALTSCLLLFKVRPVGIALSILLFLLAAAATFGVGVIPTEHQSKVAITCLLLALIPFLWIVRHKGWLTFPRPRLATDRSDQTRKPSDAISDGETDVSKPVVLFSAEPDPAGQRYKSFPCPMLKNQSVTTAVYDVRIDPVEIGGNTLIFDPVSSLSPQEKRSLAVEPNDCYLFADAIFGSRREGKPEKGEEEIPLVIRYRDGTGKEFESRQTLIATHGDLKFSIYVQLDPVAEDE